MENEKNEDIETSENNEELDETIEDSIYDSNEEELDDIEDTSSDDTDSEEPSELAIELAKVQKKNKQLYARLKKAETGIKKTNDDDTDETKLIRVARMANSLDEEDLEVLKSINGDSISDKVNNPLFKAYKAEQLRKKRSEASALKPSSPGASRGSKTFNDPELTDEQHRKLWENRTK